MLELACNDCRYSQACRAAPCSARFLVLAFGAADKRLSAACGGRDMHFHGEHLAMLGALFLYHGVTGLRAPGGMHDFLQCRLVVRDRQLALAELLQFVECRLKNCVDDEPMCLLDSCIEKEGCNQGFQRIYQKRALAAAAAFFLAFAEAQVLADFQLPAGRTKARALTMCARSFDKSPSAYSGNRRNNSWLTTNDKNRVAEELQLLIIARRSGERCPHGICTSASRAKEEWVRAWSRMARRWNLMSERIFQRRAIDRFRLHCS